MLYAGVRLHAADPARPRTGDSWKPPLGLDAYMPVPEDNPLSAGKAALGKRLFFDKALSRDRSISCATCHDPAHAFTDDRAAAVGVFGRKGPRRVPKLVNRGYGRSFFWDGRIATLEQQTLQPIQNELEMDLTLDDAVRRLRDSAVYSAEFLKMFRREVHADDLGKALAAYVRTIVSGDSPYDRYMNGNPGALPPEARLGLDIFRGKGNCGACHIGPNLTDESFHNTGVGWEDGEFTDPGDSKSAATEPTWGLSRHRRCAKPPPPRPICTTAVWPLWKTSSNTTTKEASRTRISTAIWNRSSSAKKRSKRCWRFSNR